MASIRISRNHEDVRPCFSFISQTSLPFECWMNNLQAAVGVGNNYSIK